jgi:hypothetical protein
MPSITTLKTALEGLLWAANDSKAKNAAPDFKMHDPLCTLIRFALLPLKPQGTKLNILSYKITFRPPHCQQAYLLKMPVQDDYRWSQEDFYLLHDPIVRAVNWYVKEPLAKMIFEMAIDGIKQSLDFYDKRSKEAYLALSNFLHIIEKGLKSDYKEVKTSELIIQKNEAFLKTLWTNEEMYAVYRLLALLQKTSKEILSCKKKSKNISSATRNQTSAIEVILQDKEERIARYIKSHP